MATPHLQYSCSSFRWFQHGRCPRVKSVNQINRAPWHVKPGQQLSAWRRKSLYPPVVERTSAQRTKWNWPSPPKQESDWFLIGEENLSKEKTPKENKQVINWSRKMFNKSDINMANSCLFLVFCQSKSLCQLPASDNVSSMSPSGRSTWFFDVSDWCTRRFCPR